MIREPVVAGQFYPASPAQLKAMIESFVDRNIEKEDVIGLIAPHAGYIYSGAVAGATLSRVEFRDTFIIIGPNHTGYGKPFSVMTEGTWRTPLGDVEVDQEMAEKLVAVSKHLEPDLAAHRFEHSIEVQLPFLQYFKPDVKIVPIIFATGDLEVFQEIGREIARAVRELKREVIVFASSDMNHYESQRIAQKKDHQAIEAILEMNEAELFRRVQELDITMCGFAPAITTIVAARELGGGKAELVKYQTSGDVSGDYDSVVGYAGIIIRRLSPLVQLAKNAVETFVRERRIFEPRELTPEMRERAGVFVCIKKNGELRGCIGTFEPCQENIAREVIANAIATATRDPRFEPVEPEELKELEYTVDVLTRPEPVPGKEYLDPKKYGVIVEAGYRRGLLLPDLEGVDTVDYQIEICRQKAGIGPDEPVKLYRFEVKRYK
ncbi:MAG: MEMO1 family protein [Dehalococcoidales bacterium]|jgi:AmmeMemoRadiSam system protein B/AmmeMemoRadiSam system protein A|nr:MEMO1 family protein [Dehalococcoidales bacterium]